MDRVSTSIASLKENCQLLLRIKTNHFMPNDEEFLLQSRRWMEVLLKMRYVAESDHTASIGEQHVFYQIWCMARRLHNEILESHHSRPLHLTVDFPKDHPYFAMTKRDACSIDADGQIQFPTTLNIPLLYDSVRFPGSGGGLYASGSSVAGTFSPSLDPPGTLLTKTSLFRNNTQVEKLLSIAQKSLPLGEIEIEDRPIPASVQDTIGVMKHLAERQTGIMAPEQGQGQDQLGGMDGSGRSQEQLHIAFRDGFQNALHDFTQKSKYYVERNVPGLREQPTPYQRDGVGWVYKTLKAHHCALMVDEDATMMPLEIITLIHLIRDDIKHGRLHQMEQVGPTLLVVQPESLAHWTWHFRHLTPGLRVQHHSVATVMTCSEMRDCDVVLTTYDTVALEWENQSTMQKKAHRTRTTNLRTEVREDNPSPDDPSRQSGLSLNDFQVTASLFAVSWSTIILDDMHGIGGPRTVISRAVTDLKGCFRVAVVVSSSIHGYANISSMVQFLHFRPLCNEQKVLYNLIGAKQADDDIELRTLVLACILRNVMLKRPKINSFEGQYVSRGLPIETLALICSLSKDQQHTQQDTRVAWDPQFRSRHPKGFSVYLVADHFDQHTIERIHKARMHAIHPTLINAAYTDVANTTALELTSQKSIDLISFGSYGDGAADQELTDRDDRHRGHTPGEQTLQRDVASVAMRGQTDGSSIDRSGAATFRTSQHDSPDIVADRPSRIVKLRTSRPGDGSTSESATYFPRADVIHLKLAAGSPNVLRKSASPQRKSFLDGIYNHPDLCRSDKLSHVVDLVTQILWRVEQEFIRLVKIERYTDAGRYRQEHKIVIYSEYLAVLDLVEAGLFFHSHHGCLRYDASQSAEENSTAIDRFEERGRNWEDCRTESNERILLTTGALHRSGVELLCASHLIFVSPDWSPGVIERCISGCRPESTKRIGTVYRFYTDGSIECLMRDRNNERSMSIAEIIDQRCIAQNHATLAAVYQDREAFSRILQ